MVIAYLFHAPLLTTFTNIWVVDEEAVPADAVVVLGGGANTRTFAAAEAYNEGLVSIVLIPQVKIEPIEKLGIVKTHTQICKEVVLNRGVPESAIEYIGDEVSSSWEEALAIKEWGEANNAELILVPTEFPHTRRLRWVYDNVLGDSATDVHILSIEPLNYEQESWWNNEYGLIDFQNELIKYAL